MAPHVLFEEDGAFRAGTVLSGTDGALQVEVSTGRRVKVKSSHVLLRFELPAPGQLLQAAQRDAESIDLDFLWECAPQDEFGFEQLAREYHGHAPSAVEAAAILLRLHGAPAYFHRKGRGRYRPAPADILKAALAALERKRQQDALRQQYVDALAAGAAPAAIGQQAITLLVRPDKMSIEYKALEQAAAAAHLTPLRLLLKVGAIASPYRWHVDSFTAVTFPRGTDFPAPIDTPTCPVDLPRAPTGVFSIDDSATTEIDDAFSVQRLDTHVRVGIHIAAPAAAIARDSTLDNIGRQRLSTVYAPGIKFTMLPEACVNAFSLNEGSDVPVLSLYVDVDDGLDILATETRLERARITANLRHDRLDDVITEDAIAAGLPGLPQGSDLVLLWRFANALLARRERVRGRPEPRGRIDYGFVLDGEAEQARVSIRPRKRGAPLDLIVAELMILANSTWGEWLARERRAGIYRSQSLGRVRMSTTPAPHEGIGVDHYAWSTSPLRRYVDLVNQRQLIAAARGAPPPYAANDAELFAVVSAFDAAYASYADFQSRMERYWCLRWLRQESVSRIGATMLKGDVLRLNGLPYVTRVPGLPELPRGQRIEVDIVGADEIDTTLQLRLHRVLTAQVETDEALDAEAGEIVMQVNSGTATDLAAAVAPAGAVPQAG